MKIFVQVNFKMWRPNLVKIVKSEICVQSGSEIGLKQDESGIWHFLGISITQPLEVPSWMVNKIRV